MKTDNLKKKKKKKERLHCYIHFLPPKNSSFFFWFLKEAPYAAPCLQYRVMFQSILDSVAVWVDPRCHKWELSVKDWWGKAGHSRKGKHVIEVIQQDLPGDFFKIREKWGQQNIMWTTCNFTSFATTYKRLKELKTVLITCFSYPHTPKMVYNCKI